MTKEQNEFIRMCKPIKHRGLKKLNMYIHDVWSFIKTKAEYTKLNLGANLGFICHEKLTIEEPVNNRVVTKAAGSVVTNNVCFNVQINSWEQKIEHIDRYLNKNSGKILKDDTVSHKLTCYSAFPINIQVRIQEKDSFKLVKYYDDLVVRMPKEPYFIHGMPKADMNIRYESYHIDLTPVKRLKVEKEFSNLYIDGVAERIEFENALCKDMVEELDRYMRNCFSFTECLRKTVIDHFFVLCDNSIDENEVSSEV